MTIRRFMLLDSFLSVFGNENDVVSNAARTTTESRFLAARRELGPSQKRQARSPFAVEFGGQKIRCCASCWTLEGREAG